MDQELNLIDDDKQQALKQDRLDWIFAVTTPSKQVQDYEVKASSVYLPQLQ